MEVYLDNSATTPVYPEVVEEMKIYFKEEWGNPSSIYAKGRYAKQCITNARERIAKILNCEPEEIYFTSGGSESDNLFIKGCFKENSAIITSPIEHPAVLNACKSIHRQGCLQITLPVATTGIIDMDGVKQLEGLIKKEKPIFATVMLVNNETGMIQPIKELCSYLKSIVPNIIFHTDAVQAVGKVSLDVKELGVDSLSLSGHKFGAPKGIGIFYLKKGIKCNPLIDGGGQENGLRNGTENVPYIMGIAKALEITYEHFDKNIEDLKKFDDEFLTKLMEKVPEAELNTPREKKAYGILNISFKNFNAQNLLLFLDSANVYVSAGSACHSDSDTPSHVLVALGKPTAATLSSLRFSAKTGILSSEIDYVIDNIRKGLDLQKKYQI